MADNEPKKASVRLYRVVVQGVAMTALCTGDGDDVEEFRSHWGARLDSIERVRGDDVLGTAK